MDKDKNWSRVLDIIKDQISSANFRTWFAKTSAHFEGEGMIVISVPSAFIKQQIIAKYLPLIEAAAESVVGDKIFVDFKIDASLDQRVAPKEEEELVLSLPNKLSEKNVSGLNPRYTLENFVVGLSNNLAYAAAQQVVQNPGKSYNPLFIYGGTGVGKTHLMHGVGNTLLKKNPNTRVVYCPSERFMNDFISSIQTKKTNEFRTKYRSCDLLLIDDIQFISGRDSTQEEFFHTFNDLQVKNCQIILTSDRPPNDIQKLEPRLQSRFQGGLMVDIQLPDFDTRVAILRARCQESGDTIPESCLTLIAESMPTNARELEGKLTQIIQTAKLTGKVIEEVYVRNYLGSPQITTQKFDQKKVITTINHYFNIKMTDLTGQCRKKELVLPRQVAMFILYEECKLPFERIGEILGGRDHTTIMHGVEKIREASIRDREIQRMVIEVKQGIIT